MNLELHGRPIALPRCVFLQVSNVRQNEIRVVFETAFLMLLWDGTKQRRAL